MPSGRSRAMMVEIRCMTHTASRARLAASAEESAGTMTSHDTSACAVLTGMPALSPSACAASSTAASTRRLPVWPAMTSGISRATRADRIKRLAWGSDCDGADSQAAGRRQVRLAAGAGRLCGCQRSWRRCRKGWTGGCFGRSGRDACRWRDKRAEALDHLSLPARRGASWFASAHGCRRSRP